MAGLGLGVGFELDLGLLVVPGTELGQLTGGLNLMGSSRLNIALL